MVESESTALPLGYSGMMVGGTGIEPASIRLRVCCVTLTPTSHWLGGAPGNRTRLFRIKSPQRHLDANTPFCFGPPSAGLCLRFIRAFFLCFYSGKSWSRTTSLGHGFTVRLHTPVPSLPVFWTSETSRAASGLHQGGSLSYGCTVRSQLAALTTYLRIGVTLGGRIPGAFDTGLRECKRTTIEAQSVDTQLPERILRLGWLC